MKKIEAIIRSAKFEEVREALGKIGISFFTFMEVKGYGHQKGEHRVYRGTAYDIGYIARLKLEILVEEDKLETAVKTICESARTGEIGDGKIMVSSIEHVMRIRTGEVDSDAIT
jgi:nitrogen regulatory protein P-II 1